MPESRHVVLVTTDFRPMTGGVADYLHRTAEALAGRMPVTVMTSVPQNGASWEHAYQFELLAPLPERLLGSRVGDGFAPTRRLHTGAYFLRLKRYADRVLARARDRSPDAVLLVGIWDTASHFWCEAARRAGVPYYLVAYGVELLIPMYGRLPEWRRIDFARATRVIAISEATADLAVGRFGLSTRPPVVNPGAGLRPAAAAIAARAAKLRRTLDLDGADPGPTLLSVGRLVPRKGFDLVLHSVAWLRRRYPNIRYIIVGTGPERMRLETLAGDLGIASNVRLLGQADEITKWAAYEVCDVFVMPNRALEGSQWEGFGIVFVEAALAARPSVGGRSGGTEDAVIDRQTGLLVDPERPGELTDAIRRLLEDRDLRGRLGRAGEARARAEFSSETLADRFRIAAGWA